MNENTFHSLSMYFFILSFLKLYLISTKIYFSISLLVLQIFLRIFVIEKISSLFINVSRHES